MMTFLKLKYGIRNFLKPCFDLPIFGSINVKNMIHLWFGH